MLSGTFRGDFRYLTFASQSCCSDSGSSLLVPRWSIYHGGKGGAGGRDDVSPAIPVPSKSSAVHPLPRLRDFALSVYLRRGSLDTEAETGILVQIIHRGASSEEGEGIRMGQGKKLGEDVEPCQLSPQGLWSVGYITELLLP